ncbi:hypothetical protein AB0P02_06795 [Streptomyces griseoluteus]|uniref:hypothetical protein n=1 Tax=Streptomyces griseoluteus TaxID=29306 RepID=UPI003433044E
MRAILFGALLGLLLLTVSPAALGAAALALATQPVAIAFGAGLVVRPALARRMRGWTA